MAKLKMFEISFSNMNGVFYAGTILHGHVTVGLNRSMQLRGITLRFKGRADVKWSETTGTGDDSRTDHFSAKEVYFKQYSLLFGKFSTQGGNDIRLAEGRHDFPFQFQIPHGVPSSFEGSHGHIKYTVKCTIGRAWKFDHTIKRPFTIISILDLNLQPNCLERIERSDQKQISCLFWTSGSIKARFYVNRAGYVPGEAIKLFAEIRNDSDLRMNKSYVALKMEITYRAKKKLKTEIKEVARVTRPRIEPHEHDQWNGEQLVIPPLPPSFLAGCGIIDIKYILQLNVDPSGLFHDLKVPLEILIGTIPLVSVAQRHPPMPQLPPAGVDNWNNPSTPSRRPDYPPTGLTDIPPPSYDSVIRHEQGDNEYATGNMDATISTHYNWRHTPGASPNQTGKR
ncbi:hypothetical protein BsWGS_05534 [Bradybaena similaris]